MILKIIACFFMICHKRMMKSIHAQILREGMMIANAPYQSLQRQTLILSIKKLRMRNIPVLNSSSNSVKKRKETLVEIEL